MRQFTKSHEGVKTVITTPWLAGQSDWLLAGRGGPQIANPQTAYGVVPLLYRAVKLRIDALDRIPVYVYQGKTEIEQWPFEESLRLKDFIVNTERALLLRGGSFTVKVKGEVMVDAKPVQVPMGLQWLNPFFVTVWYAGGELRFMQSVAGQTFPQNQSRYWTQEEMIYWREFNPVNDIQPGVAPAQVAMIDAQVSVNISQFLQQFFESGAMPATMITVPEGTGKEAKEELEGWFQNKLKGLRNAWKAIAVKGEVKVDILTPELKTFEINRLDDHTIEAVCNAFDIPQTILRSGSANRATAETEYSNYLQHTIIPRSSWFEERINAMLKEYGDYHIEFAPNELPEMQADEKARSEAFLNYVNGGMPAAIAAEICKIPIPDAYRATFDKVMQQKNPVEMISPEIKAELQRYERKSIKSVSEGKSAQVDFRTELIPEQTMQRLGFLLSDATSKHDVENVFKAIGSHIKMEVEERPKSDTMIMLEAMHNNNNALISSMKSSGSPITLNLPDTLKIPAPIVNVAAPVVNIQPPTVNIQPPQVTVQAPNVTVESSTINVAAPNVDVKPADVNVTIERNPVSLSVEYDSNGNIKEGQRIMADNITFQSTGPVAPPPGMTVATKHFSGAHVQVIMLQRATAVLPAATVTVNKAEASVVAANADRMSLYLMAPQDNADRISISLDGNAAVLDAGITLYPGEGWQMERHTYTDLVIRAISGTDGQKLSVQEWSAS